MLKVFLAAAAAALVFQGAARAQTASIATTGDGTAIYFYGLAVAKAAAETTGADIRPKPYKSAGQGAVFVDRGEVELGLHNAIILYEAHKGLGFYEGRALYNIRLVARLAPFRLTFGTRGGSGIETVADLKGKRFPAGFDATAFGDRLYEAMLETGGLTLADVEKVTVSDWAALGKAFVRGSIDVNGLVVGSATVERYVQQVDGYRAVSLGNAEGAEARLNAKLPNSRLVVAEPEEGLAAIDRPVVVLEYDYWIFAHKDTPDATVRTVLQSLTEGGPILARVSPDLSKFDPELMYQDIGVPFHPAALAFYGKTRP